jgi:hypothetical protein
LRSGNWPYVEVSCGNGIVEQPRKLEGVVDEDDYGIGGERLGSFSGEGFSSHLSPRTTPSIGRIVLPRDERF